MILFFEPLFKEKIWGGNRLSSFFNYSIPSNKTGECWGISGLNESSNKVLNGPYAGESLYDLWHTKKHLFGNNKTKEFPILVKLIDAKEDLSIQVHPDDTYAKKYHAVGKSECWYILDTEKDAEIIIGHHAKTFREFEKYVENKQFLDLVKTYLIKPNDFFFINAGTLHAIKKGTLLLEVQQSSDITFRFYDYDRLENNEKRQLHLQEALDVVTIPDNTLNKNKNNDFFVFNHINHTKHSINTADIYGDYLVITNGHGLIDKKPFKKGDFIMASSNYQYSLSGSFECVKVTIK